MTFRDRWNAGAALAPLLRQYATERNVVVLGLARGGVPIGRRVADAIGAYVKAPVLMIAGARDRGTIERNKSALPHFSSGARLFRVKGAGHTFEEPGALGAVAEHALGWLRTLTPNGASHETTRTTAPFHVAHD